MEDLIKAFDAMIDMLEKLANSSSSVIAAVVIAILGLAVWKLTVYVVKYMLKHATKLGHVESIAVGYKALYENKDPVQALREIKREMDDL